MLPLLETQPVPLGLLYALHRPQEAGSVPTDPIFVAALSGAMPSVHSPVLPYSL